MTEVLLQLPELKGVEISPGIVLLEEPTPIPGTALFRCLANVHGCLAVVELKLKFKKAEIDDEPK